MAQEVELTEELKTAIRQSRQKILDNCVSLVGEAIECFERDCFARACFLAMTAIEEAGKLTILRFFAHKQLEELGFPESAVIEPKELMRFLRGHPEKAREAAVWSLYINAGADRRHGNHPTSGMGRTSGVILLVRSGRWMTLRNACLYVDLDFEKAVATSPNETVTSGHGYYMICMAHEVIAEQAPAAIEESTEHWLAFEEAQKARLSQFMTKWGDTVDVDDLDFLAHPEILKEEARQRGA